jgi:adenylate cyclase
LDTDDAQSRREAGPAEPATAPKSLATAHKLAFAFQQKAADWHLFAKRIGAAIAALAAFGAILSGLTGYWSTYKVVVAELFGLKPAVHAPSAGSFEPPRLSIAVMPFDNLSGDPSQDYFGDGIVDNLTTDLSMNSNGLLVIARGSTVSYKGQKIDPKQIGRELNVRYLLHGSVLRTGSQVRINARLVDTESGAQLWADRFDGDTSSVIALQDHVTSRISTSLHVALVTVGVRQANSRSNPDAFDMVLRAQMALFDERWRNANPRRQTEEYYRKALAIDPENADAAMGLAGVLSENLVNSSTLPADARPSPARVDGIRSEMLDLLQKASRGGVYSTDAHVARAHLDFYDHRLEDARNELERALAINPNSTLVLFNLAWCYYLSGAPDKALPFFEQFQIRTAGRGASARGALALWGRSYLLLGRYDEAVQKFQQAQAVFSDPALSGAIAAASVQAGIVEVANAEYKAFRHWYLDNYGTSPTIMKIREDARRSSQEPNFLRLYEATFIEGFRKLGMPEV